MKLKELVEASKNTWFKDQRKDFERIMNLPKKDRTEEEQAWFETELAKSKYNSFANSDED